MTNQTLADILVILHTLWVIWMISGVAVALFGFRWPRLWEWKWFRITHLAGMLLTASTPIWSEGICPLTTWEYQLRDPATETRSLIARFFENVLYWDVPLIYLSLLSAAAAFATILIFIIRPPWRKYT